MVKVKKKKNMNVETSITENYFVIRFSLSTESKIFISNTHSINLYDLKNELHCYDHFEYWDELCKKRIVKINCPAPFSFADGEDDMIVFERYNFNPIIKIPFEVCSQAFQKVRDDIGNFIVQITRQKLNRDEKVLTERLEKLRNLEKKLGKAL